MVAKRKFSRAAEFKAEVAAKKEDRLFKQAIAKDLPPYWSYAILALGILLVFVSVVLCILLTDSRYVEPFPMASATFAGMAGVGCIVFFVKKWGEF